MKILLKSSFRQMIYDLIRITMKISELQETYTLPDIFIINKFKIFLLGKFGGC